MEWLNFHHLRYFFVVVREGSIAKASRVLHTSQPAISTQLRQLERALGERLLQKQGRGLVVTDIGRMVFGYAEQIFQLGRELLDTVRDRPTGRPLRLQVGLADVVPKDLAFRLLEPLLVGPAPVRLVVHENRAAELLAELAVFRLDLVVGDAPAAAGSRVKAYHHLLGACGVGVFGREDLAAPRRPGFPGSLQGARFVLPLEHSELRREFDAWTRDQGLAVEVAAEVEDDALARALAVAGHGLLLAPRVLAPDLAARHGLLLVGEVPIETRYYAITVERRVRHPGVVRVLEAARGGLFR